MLRGLYLFPYVAPVIAVAFAWIILFDPFSGSANALLIQMGVTQGAINFFGERPLALIMVTVFEIWRYFPLSFLFILARMQSIPSDMYEAADMDGASPFQQFAWLSLPQLLGILSVLFLLRFIWTFNKFDDIFLLTGGNAGTRTLTVNVYEQAFAISNIGAGAAVAVVIFACLLLFSAFFFRFISREEGCDAPELLASSSRSVCKRPQVDPRDTRRVGAGYVAAAAILGALWMLVLAVTVPRSACPSSPATPSARRSGWARWSGALLGRFGLVVRRPDGTGPRSAAIAVILRCCSASGRSGWPRIPASLWYGLIGGLGGAFADALMEDPPRHRPGPERPPRLRGTP